MLQHWVLYLDLKQRGKRRDSEFGQQECKTKYNMGMEGSFLVQVANDSPLKSPLDIWNQLTL